MPQTNPKTESRAVEVTPNLEIKTPWGADSGSEFHEPSEQQQEQPRTQTKEVLTEKISVVGKIGKNAQDQGVSSPAPLPKTAVRLEIESVLSEHINAMISHMDVEAKTAFKLQANETASTIEKRVNTAKATAKKVIRLITTWLRLIPGVNEFYIEQEAKIKADKILELQNRHPETRSILKEEA